MGRKVVSNSGHLLGTMQDVLLDGEAGQIAGYVLEEPDAGWARCLVRRTSSWTT